MIFNLYEVFYDNTKQENLSSNLKKGRSVTNMLKQQKNNFYDKKNG